MNAIPVITFFSTENDAKSKSSLIYSLASLIASTGKGVLCVDFDQNLLLAKFFYRNIKELVNQKTNDNNVEKSNYDIINSIVYTSENNPSLQLMIGDFLSSERIHLNNITVKAKPEDIEFIHLSLELASQLQAKAREVKSDFIFVNINLDISPLEKSISIFSDLLINIIHLDDFMNLVINRRRTPYLYQLISNYKSISKEAGDRISPYSVNRVILHSGYISSRMDVDNNIAFIDEKHGAFGQIYSENTLAVIPELPILTEMANNNNKSVLDLTPSDGAIGAYTEAIIRYRSYINQLANNIAVRCKFSS